MRASDRHRIARSTRRPRAAGFTLFEIAVSLGLISISVVSVLLLFPAGLKAEQNAKFRLLASAKMLELVDLFANANDGNPSMDHEGPEPWDVVVAYRSRSFDLEALAPSHRSGIAPLPLALARRIDSDGDEIGAILDAGGYVYYSQPQLTGNFDERVLPAAPPNEAQRLVFAVTGYAQENALHSLPWKSWPYYAPYPSPPYHVHHEGDFWPRAPDHATKFGAPNCWNYECYLWEAAQDPDVQPVFQWPEIPDADIAKNYGYMPYAYPSATPTTYHLPSDGDRRYPPTRDGCIRYVMAALWYCAKKGFGPEIYAPDRRFDISSDPQVAADQVRALRYVAHAAIALTRWYDHAQLSAGVAIPPADVPVADLVIDGVAAPKPTYTEDILRQLHANCLRAADTYAASFPYDWRSLRPIENAIMMHHPLIQWDLFGPRHAGVVTGDGHPAEQWKPISGSPVARTGPSISYPGEDIDGIWGTNERFSLAAPFAADERCRQVVFWSVDWQSFADFETAPSAPVDASRYLKGAPEAHGGALSDMATMMWNHDWVDLEIWNYRNPEKAYLFWDKDVPLLPSGSAVADKVLGADGWQDRGLWPLPAGNESGQAVFSGLNGADRNYNGRLDRGPLPSSARLRATLVARFNYYDPRVHLCLR